jgi:hypothetical protein
MGSGVGLPPEDPEERGTPWVRGHPNSQNNKDFYWFFGTELLAFDRREYSRDPRVISPLIITVLLLPPPQRFIYATGCTLRYQYSKGNVITCFLQIGTKTLSFLHFI